MARTFLAAKTTLVAGGRIATGLVGSNTGLDSDLATVLCPSLVHCRSVVSERAVAPEIAAMQGMLPGCPPRGTYNPFFGLQGGPDHLFLERSIPPRKQSALTKAT